MFNTSYDFVYICINGFLSFNSNLCPSSISTYSSINYSVIGAFSVDLDTRNNSGNIYYRETTKLNQISSIKKIIQNYFNIQNEDLELNSAFLVTYDNVPFYGNSNTKNTFQIVLANSKKCETFAIFTYNYLDIKEAYGGYSAGNNEFFKQISSEDLSYIGSLSRTNVSSQIVFKLTEKYFSC
jgi:hypothetical protein